MANMKRKLGAALGALALMVGAIPGTVGMASAYENPNGGQHFDRGRFPRTYHIIIGVVAVAGLIYLVARTKNSDTPASP